MHSQMLSFIVVEPHTCAKTGTQELQLAALSSNNADEVARSARLCLYLRSSNPFPWVADTAADELTHRDIARFDHAGVR